jgi:hypothetical protein
VRRASPYSATNTAHSELQPHAISTQNRRQLGTTSAERSRNHE